MEEFGSNWIGREIKDGADERRHEKLSGLSKSVPFNNLILFIFQFQKYEI